MPLPHYSQISSHNEKWEPVWTSLFEITFGLPESLNRTTEEVKLMLENASSINLPLTPDIGIVMQRFKYSTRAFVALPTQTHVQDIAIKFSLNQNDRNGVFVWNILKAWYDLGWNQATGEAHTKVDLCGSLSVNVHDKKGRVIRRVTYRNVQLYSLDGWELSWEDSTKILEVGAKFVADYYEDLYLDR